MPLAGARRRGRPRAPSLLAQCAPTAALASRRGRRAHALLLLALSAPTAALAAAGGAAYAQTGYLPSAHAGDAQGWSLAASADGLLLCAGAPGAAGGAGAIRTYVRSSPRAAWALASQFSPLANETMGGAAYGAALALSADGSLLLSAVYTSYESEGGAALLAAAPPPAPRGAWRLLQLIQAALPGDQLGAAAALAADARTLALGATYGSGGEGAVHVFLPGGGGGRWQEAQLLAPSAASGVRGLGGALALSADGAVLAAGAAGAVLLYATAAPGGARYALAQTLTARGGADGDGFGGALALDAAGGTLIVGASGASAAYVFLRGSGGGAFVQAQRLQLGAPAAELGWSVALAAGGSVALVGGNSARAAASAPVVLLRGGGGGGNWSAAQSLTPAAGSPPDGAYLGYAAALSASGALIAAGAVGDAGGAGGAVYIFEAGGAPDERPAAAVRRAVIQDGTGG